MQGCLSCCICWAVMRKQLVSNILTHLWATPAPERLLASFWHHPLPLPSKLMDFARQWPMLPPQDLKRYCNTSQDWPPHISISHLFLSSNVSFIITASQRTHMHTCAHINLRAAGCESDEEINFPPVTDYIYSSPRGTFKGEQKGQAISSVFLFLEKK